MLKRYSVGQGFTIVELLIVIVVIAILAAISVVAYTNIQNRTHDSAIQSDLRNIATKLEVYKADYGAYPSPTSSAQFNGLGITASKTSYDTTSGLHTGADKYNLLYCRTADSAQFALVARSKSGNTFQLTRGTLGPYQTSVPATSVVTLCNGAGIAGSRPADWDRRFFFSQNAWVSEMGG